MNIQSISAVNYMNRAGRVAQKKEQPAPQPQTQTETSFNGIWTRMSRSYIDKVSFALRGYYPFIDGAVPTKMEDDEGRLIVPMGDNGMTKEEGSAALDFVVNGHASRANYEAAKKLSAFMDKTVDEYTPMFMEYEDKADETENTKKAHITHYDVNSMIARYEYANGIRKQPEYKPEKNVEELLSPEEFLQKMQDESVA